MLELLPECYTSKEALLDQEKRWLQELARVEEPPYARYRLALVYCLQGRVVEALAELYACRDALPKKKQSSLRLQQIIDFVQPLSRIVAKQQGVTLREGQYDWEKFGFISTFEQRIWERHGFDASAAKIWKERGFSAEAAKNWHSAGVEPDVAADWLAAGFKKPQAVKMWRRGGFSVHEALDWCDLFGEAIELAIQCRQVGLTDPQLAKQWLKIFRFPWDAVSWHERGFTPAEALGWIEAGFTDPNVALKNKQAGLSPDLALKSQS